MGYLIADTTGHPFSTIAHVVSFFPDGTMASGSGVVVGENDVLTAAHMVYQTALGGAAERVFAIPGQAGTGDAPFGVFDAALWNYYPVGDGSGMISSDEVPYDVAVLGFDEPIGGYTGWMGFDRGFQVGTVNLTGYPQAIANGDAMVEIQGPANIVLDSSGNYTGVIDISALEAIAGHSGGPVWHTKTFDSWMPDGHYVVGVVSTGEGAADISYAYDSISEWIQGNDDLITGAEAQGAVAADLIAAQADHAWDQATANRQPATAALEDVTEGWDDAVLIG